ncbi:MAG: DUF4129 domain-containing protein [Thermoplasmata archaeon]
MAKPFADRVSLVLVIVLVAALAAGAAASILASATTAPAPTSSPASELYLPLWVFFVAVLGMLAVICAAWVLVRLSSETKGVSNSTLVNALLAILVISLFIVGLRVFGVGGPPPPTCTSTCSTNSSSPTGTSGSGNTTNLSGLGAYTLFPSIPPWVPFVVLAFVVLILVVVAVPQTRRYLAERQDRLAPKMGSAPEPPGVRAALTRASAELDLGADPRLVVLALYSEMLMHLQPMVGSVETSTPEEIRTVHLVRLGVRPEAARTLTRLFEEARYSTHPMGPKESLLAQEAVRATLDDLKRRVPAA